MKRVYLALAVLGFLLPYWQFVPWLAQHGLNPPLFVHDLFANRISGFFGVDVFVSALALWIFIIAEGSRLGMRRLWLPLAGTCLVGVSFGLPLFLYLRQIHFDRSVGE
jgi:Terpene cyclase DEP1